jgi:SAM-dependent methyltransferase
MIHHIPSPATQDDLFREIHRTLAPGGRLVACDSLDLDVIRAFHEGDIFLPIEPQSIEVRLASVGFIDIAVATTDFEVRFTARKPEARRH